MTGTAGQPKAFCADAERSGYEVPLSRSGRWFIGRHLQRCLVDDHPTSIHPANAEANIAEDTGAEVLRGPLCYPSYSGEWQLGSLDLSSCAISPCLTLHGRVQCEQLLAGV